MVSRRRRRGVRRGESNLASNQFPKCSSQPEHSERFTDLSREEMREEGDRGNLGEKKESQWGKSNQAINHLPK